MREIIESDTFKRAVEALGGHRAIDQSLETLMEGLYLRPYGFPKFENDWVSFRYARTKAIGYFIPPLVFIFRVDDDQNVILEHVEEDTSAIG